MPFSRKLFSSPMLWLELFIFSWMEELCSSSWRAFFASGLAAVFADFSCSSRGRFDFPFPVVAFARYYRTYRLLGFSCLDRLFVCLFLTLLVDLSAWNLLLWLFVFTGVSAQESCFFLFAQTPVSIGESSWRGSMDVVSEKPSVVRLVSAGTLQKDF